MTLEHAVAAPFCTRQLADLGARVIKIERPGSGDFARNYDERVRGQSSYFVWANRSKESLALDVKQAEADGILKRLLARADVLVQNLAPGAADRLGLSYERLKDENPRLIVCDISGYGSDGPYRDRKAYDLLIQSESGFLSVTGTEEEPCKAGCSIADISAGMYAYSNILAALIQRGKTGQGGRIDVSMLESMAEWMGASLYYAFDGANQQKRTGAAHATIYPYGPFPTGDGQTVILGIQNEREWKKFCEDVLELPELLDDARFASNSGRVAVRDELRKIIAKSFSSRTLEQVTARLDKARIAFARMNEMKDVWAHPQLKARKRWFEVMTPSGKIAALLPPGQSPGEEFALSPVPALGQHTEEILLEIGYSREAIGKFRELGAIRLPAKPALE